MIGLALKTVPDMTVCAMKRSLPAIPRLVTAALALLTAVPVCAEVTITGTTTASVRSTDFTINFPADTADKLVVVVTGEHGFNNAAGKLNSLTYDGVELTQAVYRPAQVPQTDILYHGIWYLDNPTTSDGNIRVQVTNRGTVSAFLVNGTAAGHGATEITLVGERSIDLTTSATNSMVFVAMGVGGDGNTGNTNAIDPDAPMIEVSAVKDPSNWQGHVVGTQVIDPPGPNSFSFTGGVETGAVVAAVEFLSADGAVGVGGLLIREISFSATTNEVTLTWNKTGSASYAVRASTDLIDFSATLDDAVTEASDINPVDAETITVNLPLPTGLEGAPKLFFRVEEGL